MPYLSGVSHGPFFALLYFKCTPVCLILLKGHTWSQLPQPDIYMLIFPGLSLNSPRQPAFPNPANLALHSKLSLNSPYLTFKIHSLVKHPFTCKQPLPINLYKSPSNATLEERNLNFLHILWKQICFYSIYLHNFIRSQLSLNYVDCNMFIQSFVIIHIFRLRHHCVECLLYSLHS